MGNATCITCQMVRPPNIISKSPVAGLRMMQDNASAISALPPIPCPPNRTSPMAAPTARMKRHMEPTRWRQMLVALEHSLGLARALMGRRIRLATTVTIAQRWPVWVARVLGAVTMVNNQDLEPESLAVSVSSRRTARCGALPATAHRTCALSSAVQTGGGPAAASPAQR